MFDHAVFVQNEGLSVPIISASEPVGAAASEHDEWDDFKLMDDVKEADDSKMVEVQLVDEWDDVSDFVLTEYIKDVSDEIDDLFHSLDEFMRRMAFLGVNSERSRSRALALLEEMRNRKEAQRIADELKVDEQKQEEVDGPVGR